MAKKKGKRTNKKNTNLKEEEKKEDIKVNKNNEKNNENKVKENKDEGKQKEPTKETSNSEISSLLAKPKLNIRKIERIATGISNFDKLVEGGFKKNSTTLLVGSSGSGKSIFSVQFLLEGIKKGECCLYITFEEKKSEFFSNMFRLGWDLEKFEKQGKFIFLEYTPEKVRTMLEEGGGIIENIVLEKKVARIVIDSISSFELLFEKSTKKRTASLALFNMLRKWDTTTLLTCEANPLNEEKVAANTLEFEADSIIAFYFLRFKDKRERFLEVIKMRGTDHAREVYPFEINVKKGKIDISTKHFSGDLR